MHLFKEYARKVLQIESVLAVLINVLLILDCIINEAFIKLLLLMKDLGLATSRLVCDTEFQNVQELILQMFNIMCDIDNVFASESSL